MANTSFVRGLHPLYAVAGKLKTNKYTLKTGQTVYIGSILSVDAANRVLESTANDGVKIIGVSNEYVDDSASAGGKTVAVYDNPFIVYECQVDATGTAIVDADGFSCANHIAGAGSATTGLSGHQWNQASIATTAKDLKLLRLVDRPGNSWGNYAKVEVMLNNHFIKGAGAAGI